MASKSKNIKARKIEASDKDRLRVNELLVGLDDKSFNQFAKRCEFVSFRKGDTLIKEGAEQDCVFLMVKGTVRVSQRDGAVGVIFREIGEGGRFGEIAAFDRGQRTATVDAVTDGVVVILPRVVFVNLILNHREIAIKVLESLASIIRSSNQQISDVSSFSGIQRVYLQLLDLAEPDPSESGSWIINNMPSHEELATNAVTSKEAVAKAISKVMQSGLIKRSSGKVKILDRFALKKIATEI